MAAAVFTDNLTSSSPGLDPFEGIFVDENEKERLMNILSQIDDFKTFKRVQQLPNNNFFFALHYMHTCYKIRDVCKDATNLSSIIKQIIYIFDLFTHSQTSNQENLNLFEIYSNQINKDYLPHRFMKKFVTFQHLKTNRSNSILVWMNSLIEYFIDNIQQGQLFTFSPQLCAVGFHSNIVLYLYLRVRFIKKNVHK